MKKAIVVIDGGYFDNLNQYLQKAKGKRLDVEKLSLKVCEGMDHLRTRFYHANPYQSETPTQDEKDRYANAQKFFYSINRLRNHEVVSVGRVKPVFFKCPKCNKEYTLPKQKGVDVAIALDIVKMSQKKVADVFVIISGDEDLTDAVNMAKENLAQVVVYFASDNKYKIFGSIKLGNTADHRVKMDLNFLEACARDA